MVDVGVGGKAYVDVLADILVDVSVDADTVVILGGNDCLILEVGDTEVVASAGGTAADAEFVVLHETGAVEQILPIGIDVFFLIDRVGELVCSLAHCQILLGVHHRELLGLLGSYICIIGNLRLGALHTFVGRDEDDTVGASGTVDSGRSGVLEDVHALDVAGADFGKVAHEGDTVEDDKGIVGCREGSLTTDTDLHALARLGRCLAHIDTGDTALEGVADIVGRHSAEVVSVHRCDRSCDIGLAGGAVTDDHRAFEGFGVESKSNIVGAYTGYGHLFGNIADIRYYKDGICRNVDDVLAVDIRANTICRSLDHDESAGKRLSVSLGNNTFHSEILGGCDEGKHQPKQH